MSSERSTNQNEQCPVCETELVSYDNPAALWCEECQMEYWREAESWFRCGVNTPTHHVEEVL